MEKIKLLIICSYIFPTVLFARADPLSGFYKVKTTQENKEQPTKSTQIRLGRVSMDLLFLMHPKMRNYNFAVDSFFKEIPRNLSIPIEFYLKDRNKNLKIFKKEFRKRHAQLLQEVKELETQVELARQEYIRANNNLLSDEQDKQSNISYETIEDKYWSRRSNLENEISAAKKRFDQWIENNNKDMFLSIKDRDLKMRQIVTEVKNLVTNIAQSKNIDMVFNRNAKTLGGKNGLIKLSKRRFITDGYNPLKQLLNDEFFFGYKGTGTAEEYLQTFDKYLQNYDQVHHVFSKSYTQFDTLGKVEDLTLIALRKMFQQYKYPQKLISKILEVVKSWRKQ